MDLRGERHITFGLREGSERGARSAFERIIYRIDNVSAETGVPRRFLPGHTPHCTLFFPGEYGHSLC
jgi:hypothetical protein